MSKNNKNMENTDNLKVALQEDIDGFIEILKIEMHKDNAHEITYGDKLAAIGGLNQAVKTMKRIDPDYQFDLLGYFPDYQKELELRELKRPFAFR